MRSPESRLTGLLDRVRLLLDDLTLTVNTARSLRGEASDLEKRASELGTNPQPGNEGDRPRIADLKLKASRLREEAEKASAARHRHFAELQGLAGDLRICLLQFGEQGQRVRQGMDSIHFNLLPSEFDTLASGIPKSDEQGILRGVETFGKLLPLVACLASSGHERRPPNGRRDQPQSFGPVQRRLAGTRSKGPRLAHPGNEDQLLPARAGEHRKPYSERDHAFYELIGHENLSRFTDAELWKRKAKDFRRMQRAGETASHDAFRARLYRVRKHHGVSAPKP